MLKLFFFLLNFLLIRKIFIFLKVISKTQKYVEFKNESKKIIRNHWLQVCIGNSFLYNELYNENIKISFLQSLKKKNIDYKYQNKEFGK